ncbi:MAG: methionine--tRNA ligase [Candidatus Pacebacteria bacterium CG10_big_fil_rev_8_21_14_0_10_44_11]|nr:MAG: methionine--tRNA ligase [Candidatus Pacebacteria bacterium CG10_big_fil_rev_8_21_14_0_10_44_11]
MKPSISYEDFSKLDLRIAKVIAAEPIESTDKLLKLTLDVGELGERTVVSGIKEWYTPAELVDKTVVYLANLETKMLRGVASQGMIIAAADQEAVLLQPAKPVKPGEMVR